MTSEHLDRLAIDLACQAGDAAFDPAWDLVEVTAHYNPIHTAIVSGRAHRFNASLSYALALCEAGRYERAERVLRRCLADQDADPASPTYGLWGYYAEEPVADMKPPDWNQADFNGKALAMVLLRHRSELSPAVAEAIAVALGQAACSIIRRNVSMDYTNIAAKGTFVTVAAGQLLGDDEIARYARGRLSRFAANVERTGSFVEYNSPAYWTITAHALSGIVQYCDDDEVRARADALMTIAWGHLARHWHASSGQLAGPNSRSYGDDVARMSSLLMFLRKALGEAEPFGSHLPAVPDVELVWPAVLEPRVPDEFVEQFLRPRDGELGRELFERVEAERTNGESAAAEQRGGTALPEVVGTTWRDPVLTLGTVNQADTWLQRRNLLGRWVAPGDRPWRQPARYVRLRVVRDDGDIDGDSGFDFASGSFSSVQEGARALWAVGFAVPGGDRHLHLDMLAPGQVIPVRALRVSFEFGGADPAGVWIAGRPAADGAAFESGDVVSVVSAGVEVALRVLAGGFGDDEVRGRLRRHDGLLSVDVDLLDEPEPRPLDLAAVGRAFVCGAFAMGPADGDAPGLAGASVTDAALVADAALMNSGGTSIGLAWDDLALRARVVVGSRAEHAAGFASSAGPPPASTPASTSAERE